jgi:hypothetical protein
MLETTEGRTIYRSNNSSNENTAWVLIASYPFQLGMLKMLLLAVIFFLDSYPFLRMGNLIVPHL